MTVRYGGGCSIQSLYELATLTEGGGGRDGDGWSERVSAIQAQWEERNGGQWTERARKRREKEKRREINLAGC